MSRTPEQKFWDDLRPRMEPYGRLVRVENVLMPAGTPDVYYNFRGPTGWMELKALEKAPIRSTTPIRPPHFRQEQVDWAMTEHRNRGRSFLLLRMAGCHYLFHAVHLQKLHDGRINARNVRDVCDYISGVDNFKPAELHKCLIQ